jgi:hypothetical protein
MKKTNKLALTAVLMSSILWTGCKEDKKNSVAPVFYKVTTDKTTYSKKDTVTYTVTFKEKGEYIGGTYQYQVTGIKNELLAAGQTSRYAPVDQFSEKFIALDTAGVFTLTVSAKMMAAYAGDIPYLDVSSMGSVSCTFDIKE